MRPSGSAATENAGLPRIALGLPAPPGGTAAAAPSGGAELVGVAAAPLHPLWVVQDGLGFGDASAFEEHDQVVVAVGGTEDLVPAAAVHGDSPAA